MYLAVPEQQSYDMSAVHHLEAMMSMRDVPMATRSEDDVDPMSSRETPLSSAAASKSAGMPSR